MHVTDLKRNPAISPSSLFASLRYYKICTTMLPIIHIPEKNGIVVVVHKCMHVSFSTTPYIAGNPSLEKDMTKLRGGHFLFVSSPSQLQYYYESCYDYSMQ